MKFIEKLERLMDERDIKNNVEKVKPGGGNGMEEDKFVKAGEKVQAAGKKIQQVGCALTLLITLPVVGVLFAGPIGGIIGGAIGLLLFVGMFFVK